MERVDTLANFKAKLQDVLDSTPEDHPVYAIGLTRDAAEQLLAALKD